MFITLKIEYLKLCVLYEISSRISTAGKQIETKQKKTTISFTF